MPETMGGSPRDKYFVSYTDVAYPKPPATGFVSPLDGRRECSKFWK
jgi:hypothetical protein